MTAWRTIGVGLVVVGACAVPRTSDGEDAPRAGMEAHVDPQTGRLVPEPVVPPPSRPQPIAPLPIAEVPAPGGGMMVRLNGQFMSRMVATIDADGRMHVECVTGDGPHVHTGE